MNSANSLIFEGSMPAQIAALQRLIVGSSGTGNLSAGIGPTCWFHARSAPPSVLSIFKSMARTDRVRRSRTSV
jgi:hypothetical protein